MEERDEKTATEPEIDKGPTEGEIEAHKKKIKANVEPVNDDADDVELHRKKLLK